jgi:hypothetical protein
MKRDKKQKPAPVVQEVIVDSEPLMVPVMDSERALGVIRSLNNTSATNCYYSGLSQGLSPQESLERVLARMGVKS